MAREWLLSMSKGCLRYQLHEVKRDVEEGNNVKKITASGDNEG